MRYLHVSPPVRQYCGLTFRLNQALGGPMLVAAAAKAGHAARYYDAEALGKSLDETVALVGAWGPDVVGMTVLTLGFPGVVALSHALKKRWPDLYIVLGGPHAVAQPQETLAATGADCVVVGEADEHMGWLIRERPREIAVVVAPADLDALPLPAWELSVPQLPHYVGNEPRFERPEACVTWNRGCPHSCRFCSLPLYQNASLTRKVQADRLQPLMFRPWVRTQSPARVVEELRHLKAGWGVRHCFVYSDELVGAYPTQGAWLQSVCQAVASADLGITWKTQGRCSRKCVSQETTDAMAGAGCVAVMWGIETGSAKVARALHKGTTPEDVIHTLRCAKRSGIKNWGYFMIGAPEETEADAALTEQLIQCLCAEGLLDYRQVTVCTPEVNTPLWARAEREGWLPKRDPARRWHHTPADTPWMSAGRIRYWQGRLMAAGT